ncbi:hypothetical protein [Rivularia sp. UHCC 0363]|uniref:hypothetical protein n=1 Tax=Rivularia sp. UHCC 0363 TaxID=3110244 RepID=UPI002B20DF70|nr:hypothetical protein [Rivularia sp. UHCC 0363]MEA5597781.1 hypothetical protein [Rivularia sp. UHCC 0363]
MKKLFAIKIISTVLMIGAIGLELGHIYALKNQLQIPNIISPIFWVERVAVAVHLIEAIVAAFTAGSKDRIWYKYGVYTFFVGTIGLVELFREENKSMIK